MLTRMKAALGDKVPQPAPGHSGPDEYAAYRGARAARVEHDSASDLITMDDITRYTPK